MPSVHLSSIAVFSLSCHSSRPHFSRDLFLPIPFQNSNLVLQVDYNLTDRRARDEPTGEVMPLTAAHFERMGKMGSLHQRSRPGEKKKK